MDAAFQQIINDSRTSGKIPSWFLMTCSDQVVRGEAAAASEAPLRSTAPSGPACSKKNVLHVQNMLIIK